jgi:mannitol-1-/sugar-/sorbitol-6-phosphatase
MTQTFRFSSAALLFDMDGVLIDSSAIIERSWRKWARDRRLDEAALMHLVHGRPAREVIAKVAPHLDVATELAILIEQEMTDAEGPLRFAGVHEMLHALPRGHWAIVTSAPRVIATQRLQQADLPLPEVLICAEDVTRGKPAPDGYLKAAEKLGFAPQACTVVEDSLPGIEAGLAAGMAVIGVATTHALGEITRATYPVKAFNAFGFSAAPNGLKLFST